MMKAAFVGLAALIATASARPLGAHEVRAVTLACLICPALHAPARAPPPPPRPALARSGACARGGAAPKPAPSSLACLVDTSSHLCAHPLLPQASYGLAEYAKEFGKSYAPSELEMRSALLADRLSTIRSHPETSSWRMGVNHLTDRTEEELKSIRGYDKAEMYARRRFAAQKTEYAVAYKDAPKSNPSNSVCNSDLETQYSYCDWRDAGVVTAVKDQGGCGSCWSFAGIETLESAWAIATGQLEDLSEQQMLDCSPNPQECGGTGGCGGATSEIGYASFIANGGGVVSEFDYPYESYGGKNFQCRCDYNARLFRATSLRRRSYEPKSAIVNVTNFVRLPENDQEATMEALTNIGPLSVSMDASIWYLYDGGVFTGCPADGEDVDIDHALELVGFGDDADSGLSYWIVRNSWGASWGEDGYIRILRTPNVLHCSTDDEPYDGSDCRNVTDPTPEVKVCGACGILYDVNYPIVRWPGPLGSPSLLTPPLSGLAAAAQARRLRQRAPAHRHPGARHRGAVRRLCVLPLRVAPLPHADTMCARYYFCVMI